MRFARNSEVLYTSENEKRTTALLKPLGFQLPSGLQRYGFIGSITYADGGVKFAGVPFTEIEASSESLLVSDDAGQIKQKQESADTVLKTEEGGERPDFPAKNSITQDTTESKRTDEPVKKSVRFQMAEQADREAKRNRQLFDNGIQFGKIHAALGCQLEVFLEPVGKNDIKHWSAPHPWHP